MVRICVGGSGRHRCTPINILRASTGDLRDRPWPLATFPFCESAAHDALCEEETNQTIGIPPLWGGPTPLARTRASHLFARAKAIHADGKPSAAKRCPTRSACTQAELRSRFGPKHYYIYSGNVHKLPINCHFFVWLHPLEMPSELQPVINYFRLFLGVSHIYIYMFSVPKTPGSIYNRN